MNNALTTRDLRAFINTAILAAMLFGWAFTGAAA